MYKARVNGIEIAYQVDGQRDPALSWLVFAHALACNHGMWDEQAAAFGHEFNVLRYDLRGHGASSAPAGEYTLELLADDLRGLLDTLNIRRCHFVGLSLGGMVGQMAVLRYPLRFSTLTLADTSSRYSAEMKPLWEQRIAAVRGEIGMQAVVVSKLKRWFTTATFLARDHDRLLRVAQAIRDTPIDGYIGCLRALSRLDLTSRLSMIGCPVLVLVGADDQDTPPSMAEEIVRAIDGAKFVVIPDAAHLSNIEQPGRFNAALRAFLLRHESA